MERLARVVRDRVVGHVGRGHVGSPRREPVGEAASRSPRDHASHGRVARGLAGHRRPVARVGLRLGAQHEGRPELRRARAEPQRGRDAGAVHDAAGRDHRHRQLAHEQPGQGERAQLVVGRVRVEHPAVPARLEPLRHHHLHPAVDQPPGLVDARRRPEQHDARLAQRSHLRRRRQPEVHTHHARTLGHQRPEHRLVDHEAPVDLAERPRRLGPELGEGRSEPRQPGRLAGGVGAGRRVAEHVDVERARRLLPEGLDHPAGAVRIGRPDAERAERSGVRHGRGHGRRRHACHRGLHDGVNDVEQAQQIGGRHRARIARLAASGRRFDDPPRACPCRHRPR